MDKSSRGLTQVKDGFLYYECADADLLANLEKWAGDSRKLRLPKQAQKNHQQIAVPLGKLGKSAFRSYEKAMRKGPDLD